MWSKVYFGVLAVGVIAMALFTYYSWSWLQSIGAPADALEGYRYYDYLGVVTFFTTSVLLLILGNVILWLSKNAFALWTAFLYAGFFVLLKSFWLIPSMFEFCKTNGIPPFEWLPVRVISIPLVILAGVVIFLDQYFVLKLQRKMYPLILTDHPNIESDHAEP